MTSVVHVPFYEDVLEAVRREDGVWLGVKRACENVGLSPDAQRVKLKAAPWAVTTIVAATGPDGKTYEMFAIHIKSAAMWLATIDISRVGEQARPKLVKYQCEAAEVLSSYFLGAGLAETDPLVAQAETALAITREVVRIREEQKAIKASVQALQASEADRRAQEAQAIESLRQLPAPTMEAQDRSLRSVINECVRQYGITHGGKNAYQEAWSKIYRELRYRYHFDAPARAKHRKMSRLDVIEQEGLLPQLYAIASKVLIQPRR